jgi:hypothetical protein
LLYFVFFFCKNIMKTQRRFVLVSRPRRCPRLRGDGPRIRCARIFTCLNGILTWTREFPSLSLHCQFPHCKHFNDLRFPCSQTPTEKASKKTAHSIHASREPKSVAKL